MSAPTTPSPTTTPSAPAGGLRPQGYNLLDAIRRGESVAGFTHKEVLAEKHAVEVEGFHLYYGQSHALHGITMPIAEGKVTAMIGPSGCGKSTLLRSINRMNDLVDGVRTEGHIRIHGQDVYQRGVDVISLRRRVGMVFQKPNPFPMSIYDNVAYPLRIVGQTKKARLDEAVEKALRSAAIWEEAKDRLKSSALGMSGGQQQRLCIARAIVAEPEVLLMDEPCSALDPIATLKIEELITQMSGRFPVVIVTHNMQQAGRVSDFTSFMYLGRLIEYGPTASIFQNPSLPETDQYVTGRFG